ncbi:MAG: hypothetical protein NTU73_04780 [Ignavibacteriae bacterium]|nr:hypothetical protein [Ignavibacteriota bacterium]
MKKLILLFVFTVLFFSVNVSFAQLSATTMKDIIETAQDKVKSLENTEDMEVVNITIDLLVGSKGEKYVYRYLDNSFDYKIYAVCDRRISKLNVDVRKKGTDDKWILVEKASGDKVKMDIYPDTRAFYEFTISVKEFVDDNTAGHFAILIYHIDPVKK